MVFEYTFKYGPFYFHIHANDDKDAVNKARRAVEETSPEASYTYIRVDLEAGAFDGRIYIEPEEITTNNIRNKEILPEVEEGVPF